MLTTDERIFLVTEVLLAGDKYTQNVKERFRECFPNSNCPHLDTVRDLMKKFCVTGSIHDAQRSGRSSILDGTEA